MKSTSNLRQKYLEQLLPHLTKCACALLMLCFLVGCHPDFRTIKNENGIIHSITGGVVVMNETNKATQFADWPSSAYVNGQLVNIAIANKPYFIFDTSIGKFAITTDRKDFAYPFVATPPQKIVNGFRQDLDEFLKDRGHNHLYPTEDSYLDEAYGKGSIIIYIDHSYGSRSWKYCSTNKMVLFSPWRILYADEIYRDAQPVSGFTPIFTQSVNIPFLFRETKERPPLFDPFRD